MKNKIIFISFMIVSFFIFTDKISATDTVTFACDYSFNGIKIRIKVSDLDTKYIKSDQEINKASNSSFKFTYMYADSSGNYIPFTGSTKSYAGYTNSKKSLTIFSDYNIGEPLNKKTFLKNASSSNKSIACPSVYYYYDASNDYRVVAVSSYNTYDDSGTEIPTNTTPINLDNQACYDNSSDTTPIKCDDINTGELYSENQIECVYSANGTFGSNNEFALIYDRTKNNVVFDGRGVSYAWSSQIDSTSKVVNSDKLLSLFQKKDSEKLTCPNNIECNCSSLNGCYFYSNDHKAVNKCGILKSSDGTSVDDPDYNPGDVPDLDFSDEPMTCTELLGPNLTKVFHMLITALRVAGAIIALVKATMLLMPAVVAKDAEALKKAGKSCVNLAIALVIIGLLPTFASIIGKIVDFDVTCLI